MSEDTFIQVATHVLMCNKLFFPLAVFYVLFGMNMYKRLFADVAGLIVNINVYLLKLPRETVRELALIFAPGAICGMLSAQQTEHCHVTDRRLSRWSLLIHIDKLDDP